MSAAVTSPKRAGAEHAAEHLQRLGFEVIARAHETRYGAIDLIVADAERIVFCDVRARRLGENQRSGGRAAQTHRLRRMAAAWLVDRSERPRAPELRFDTILVVVDDDGRLVSLEHMHESR